MIVVTTDGSERSHSVLPHAALLAAAAESPLTLLRVLDPRVDASDVIAPSLQEAVATVKARWTSEMEALLETRGITGAVEVALRVHGEELHEALLNAAEGLGARAIAITTRAGGALRQALLGSTASGVLGKTRVPVLVAGPEVLPQPAADGYRVFFTSDGSPSAEAALGVFTPLLSAVDAHVVLWQAAVPVTGIDGGPTAEEAARERLEEIAATLPPDVEHVVQVDSITNQAAVPDRAIERAVEEGAAVIAMSTHGKSARYQILVGSVTSAVIRKSPLPVLVAPKAGVKGS